MNVLLTMLYVDEPGQVPAKLRQVPLMDVQLIQASGERDLMITVKDHPPVLYSGVMDLRGTP